MTALTVVVADITGQQVDAIVNAANDHLQHGGGVALAIARAGRPAIQDESDAWVRDHGPLSPGRAAVTTAGAMPARWVVHVAGPVFREGQDNAGLLARAVIAALDAAVAAGARTVALPAISAGIYGYPPAAATAVVVAAVRTWVAGHPGALDEVRLVAWGADAERGFREAIGTSEPLGGSSPTPGDRVRPAAPPDHRGERSADDRGGPLPG